MYISDREYAEYTAKLKLCRGNEAYDIPKKKYMGDKRLNKVLVSSDVKSIGAWAFADCTSLIELWIPKGCKHIESTFLMDTPLLSNVVVYEPLLNGYDVCLSEGRLLAFWLKKWIKLYSCDLGVVSKEEWYIYFDKLLSGYLMESDAINYNPFLAGGEEDYDEPLNDIEYYKRTVRIEKCNVVLERLMVEQYISDNKLELYIQYLRNNVTEAMEAIAGRRESAYNYLRLYIDKVGMEQAAAFVSIDYFEEAMFAECRALLLDCINIAGHDADIWDSLII